MTWLSETILRLAGPLVLVAVFTLPALEASTLLGMVVPGELAVVLGGVLAQQGRLPLWAAPGSPRPARTRAAAGRPLRAVSRPDRWRPRPRSATGG
jgi:hypothetical protein